MKTNLIAIIIGLLLGGVWTLYFPFNKQREFGLFDGVVFVGVVLVTFVVGVIIIWVWKLRIDAQF